MYRKNAAKIILFSLCAIIVIVYLAFIFILPYLLNSKTLQERVLNFVNQKTDYKIDYKNLDFKVTKRLKLVLNADYILFDMSEHKQSKKKSNRPLNLSYIKSLDIKNADIIINSKNSFKLSNIKAIPDKNKTKITLYLNNNLITLNGQFSANPDFTIVADNLSADEIQKIFLSYMKSKKPDKNFIENFYDFEGLIDINLRIKNKDLEGFVDLKDFGAKFRIFNLPLYFKNARFEFMKDKITSNAKGSFCNNEAISIFEASDIFSNKRIVKGSIISSAQSNISKYIPNSNVNGKAELEVNYLIQNQTPVVEYIAHLNKGSSIKYNNYSIGLTDENRKVYAKTTKKGDNLKIDNFNYSLINSNKEILSGEGLLSRKNSLSKFNLEYISLKTNDYAPVDIIGSLADFIQGGEFKGELRFDNTLKILTGNFYLRETKYKDFYIKNASITADNENIKITAAGEYERSPFRASIDAVNHYRDLITINDLNMYLGQYKIKRTYKKSKTNNIKLKNAVKKLDFNIKQARIKLDKLCFRDIVLENLELIGSMKDDLIEFSMPEIRFAQGSLGAAGLYDVQYNSSFIDFYAEQINSNSASCMIFGLKDQFKGLANATMHLRTYDKLSDINAQSAFYIKDGSLTKLGSSEFIINKNQKPIRFKLADIINIDIKKMEALKSDIQGYFDIKNEKVENVEIYNENKFLSLYLEGKYNVKSQNADMILWGRYNKDAQRGIRVLFIPLSWITKFVFKNENTKAQYQKEISKSPPVEGKASQEEIVNVSASGIINDSKNLKINLRAIK
ncbi:hypothetical protein IJ531_02940 [bacterium]|nr:hypothetical protein [bacterium]